MLENYPGTLAHLSRSVWQKFPRIPEFGDHGVTKASDDKFKLVPEDRAEDLRIPLMTSDNEGHPEREGPDQACRHAKCSSRAGLSRPKRARPSLSKKGRRPGRVSAPEGFHVARRSTFG